MANKKQGKVKSIPLTKEQVIEGINVLVDGDDAIFIVITTDDISGKVRVQCKESGNSIVDASELKTLVVEYTVQIPHPELGSITSFPYQLPLKYSQWQSAIDNGEVDSDKEVEFEIVPRYLEEKDVNSSNGFAKIIPQKKQDKLLPILEALLGYGRIHTVGGVTYPAGSHKEILDKLENYLNTEYKMNKSLLGNFRTQKKRMYSEEDYQRLKEESDRRLKVLMKKDRKLALVIEKLAYSIAYNKCNNESIQEIVNFAKS